MDKETQKAKDWATQTPLNNRSGLRNWCLRVLCVTQRINPTRTIRDTLSHNVVSSTARRERD